MRRLLVFSPADSFLFELGESEVFSRVRVEEVNGEHSLDIDTTRQLQKEQRVLSQMPDGTWWEYVVSGVEESHGIGRYHCIWSLQHDLIGTTCTAQPRNATALSALQSALSGTERWQAGTVQSDGSTHTASFWRKSAWDALSIFAKTWGGEIFAVANIEGDRIVSRVVNVRMPSDGASRRFDYGYNVDGITRTVSEDPYPCRIIPLGKAQQTEEGGYGRKITIESVNDGIEWLENDTASLAVRMPDGLGGWEYPTAYVENGDCETPEELLAWGQSVLEDCTTPTVSYEADVLAYESSGSGMSGVELGDGVQIVDLTFGSEPLRIQGRVLRIEADELDECNVRLEIGHLSKTLASAFTRITEQLGTVDDRSIAAIDAAGKAQHEADLLSADLVEVSATATAAQEAADEANDKLVGVEGTVQDAIDAVDAKADNAAQVAANAYSIAEDLDDAMPGIIADVAAAQADADTANGWIQTTGAQAATTAAQAETHAQTALTNAAAAQTYAEGVNTALGNFRTNVATNYATKTEVTQSENQLKSTITTEYTTAIADSLTDYTTIAQTDSKISASASSVLSTVSDTYATKAALTITNNSISSEVTARQNADSNLSTQITQTAAAVETRFRDFLTAGSNMLMDTDVSTFSAVNAPWRRPYDTREGVDVSIVTVNPQPVDGITYGVKWAIQASAATGYMGYAFYDRSTEQDYVHGVKLVNGQKYTMCCWTFGSVANAAKGRLRLISPAYGSYSESHTILSETFDFGSGWRFVQFSCECDATRIYRAFFEVNPQGQAVNVYMSAFALFEGVPSGEYDTLIRETSAGIEVGKVNSAGSYVGARSLVSSTGSFQVLDASGTMLGSMSGTSAQIGKTATNHIVADSNGVYAYDGSNNILGAFAGTSAQVGKSTTNHVIANSNGVYVRDGSGTNLAAMTPSAVRIGRVGYANAYLSASALNFYVNETLYSYFGADEARIGRKYDDNDVALPNVYIGKRNSTDTAGVYLRTGDTVRAAMTSNGTVIGRSDKQHLVQDANGMYIYDPSPSGGDSPTANLKAAFTADAVRIGSRNTDAFSAYVTDQAFQIRQTLANGNYAVYTTVGPETARIGRQDSGYYNVLLDSGASGAGVYLRKATTNLAALTDSSVVVGKASDLHAEMVPGAFRIVDGSTVRGQFLGNVACIGNTSGYNVLVGALDDSEPGTYDGTAGVYLRSGSTVRASITPTAATFGRSDRRHLVQDANGMYIYDPTPSGGTDGTSNQRLAATASGVVVGTPTSGNKNARMTGDAFQIRDGTTVLSSFTPTAVSLGANSSTSTIDLNGNTATISNETGDDARYRTTIKRTGGGGVRLQWNYDPSMGGFNDGQRAFLDVGTNYSENFNVEANIRMVAGNPNINHAAVMIDGGIRESSSSRIRDPRITFTVGTRSGDLEDWCTEFTGLNNAGGTVFGYVRKWASGRMDSVRITTGISRAITTSYTQGSQIMGYYGANNSYTLGGTYGTIHGAEISVIPESGTPLVTAHVVSLGTTSVNAILFSPVSLSSRTYTIIIKAWGMSS